MALNWLNLIGFELFVSFFFKAILFPYETLDLFFLNIFIKKGDLFYHAAVLPFAFIKQDATIIFCYVYSRFGIYDIDIFVQYM